MIKFLSIIFIFYFSTTLLAEELFFIISQSTTQRDIEQREIKDFFLKKKQYWSNGKRVRPIGQNLGTPARKAFLKQVLKKSEIEMSEYWIEQKQVNGLVQPIQLEDNQIVIQLVKSMPGSVGYIFVESLTPINKTDLIIIKATKE